MPRKHAVPKPKGKVIAFPSPHPAPPTLPEIADQMEDFKQRELDLIMSLLDVIKTRAELIDRLQDVG